MKTAMEESFYRSRLRLMHLEKVGYWRGRVCRSDLMDLYDISTVQASKDFNLYHELNPGALVYDLRRKRYFWAEGAKAVLHVPSFEEALTEVLVAAGHGDRVLRLGYPRRGASEAVQRAFVSGLMNKTVLTVKYGSVSSGKWTERRLLPVGFGSDGFRWHARCWCFEREEYRDFVLGRIKEVLSVEPFKGALPEDAEWARRCIVSARLNSELPEEVKESLRDDFTLVEDRLEWETRAALAFYAEKYLATLGHLGEKGMMAWFVEISKAVRE